MAEQGELSIGDAIPKLADKFGLTEEQRSELLPSGRQARFANRTNWAKSYLGKAALLEFTGRGLFKASARGKQVCATPPSRITINWLMQFPEFQAFKAGGATTVESAMVRAEDDLTPDEQMRAARDRIDADLAEQILTRIVAGTPAFFERLVVRLVTAMGYGGSIADAGRALGQSGDGGVDGVIDEDALGLDRIYVQAKRYVPGNAVGPGAVRDFFGALDQFKANKGLLVTTSTFSTSAKATAEGLSKRIVLIDGARLAALMIRYDVGCRVEEVLTIKKIDEEFYGELT